MGNVKVVFIGDAGPLKKTINGLGKDFKHAGQSIAIGLGIGSAALTAFGVSSVKAYQESEEAAKKLSTNLLNVKGNTLKNVESIKKLAEALQKKGVIEDDAIIAGASQLATFNLQGKTIEKLTPKIADMVAQLKGHNATADDMVTINNLVGKVMTGNIGALSRYGVNLSENQKKQLKNANETERAALLVEVLGQNYGEVNKALRDTPQGKITGLKNKFGDLKEKVGEFVALKIFQPLVSQADKLLKRFGSMKDILKELKKFAKENRTAFSILATLLGVGLTFALYAVATAAWAATAPLLPFIGIAVALGLVVDQIVKKLGGWEEVWKKLEPVISTAWDSIKKFIDGDFSGGLFGFDENHGLVKFLKSVREGWDLVVQVVRDTVIPIFDSAERMIDEQLIPALKDLGIEGDFVKDALLLVAGAITAIVLGAIILLAAGVWGAVAAFTMWANILGWFKKQWDNIVERLGGASEIFGVFKAVLATIFYPLYFLYQSIERIVDKWNDMYSSIKKVGDAIKGFGETLGKAPESIKNILSGKPLGRAIGGPVKAGVPYTIGEGGGPETFIPDTNGYILNARQTRSMGGGNTYHFNFAGKADVTEAEIVRQFKRMETLRVA